MFFMRRLYRRCREMGEAPICLSLSLSLSLLSQLSLVSQLSLLSLSLSLSLSPSLSLSLFALSALSALSARRPSLCPSRDRWRAPSSQKGDTVGTLIELRFLCSSISSVSSYRKSTSSSLSSDSRQQYLSQQYPPHPSYTYLISLSLSIYIYIYIYIYT